MPLSIMVERPVQGAMDSLQFSSQFEAARVKHKSPMASAEAVTTSHTYSWQVSGQKSSRVETSHCACSGVKGQDKCYHAGVKQWANASSRIAS